MRTNTKIKATFIYILLQLQSKLSISKEDTNGLSLRRRRRTLGYNKLLKEQPISLSDERIEQQDHMIEDQMDFFELKDNEFRTLIQSYPYEPPAFDLQDCASYSNTWLADLAKSCPDYPFVVTADCRCATAEALLSSGEIGCGSCPSRCDVCSTCLTFAGCGANGLARASKRGWSDIGGDIETREKKKHSLD